MQAFSIYNLTSYRVQWFTFRIRLRHTDHLILSYHTIPVQCDIKYASPSGVVVMIVGKDKCLVTINFLAAFIHAMAFIALC